MGNSASHLRAGTGAFNLVGAVNTYGYNHSPAGINVEYQMGHKLHGIGFAWGLPANGDGGVDGHGGLYSNIALTPQPEVFRRATAVIFMALLDLIFLSLFSYCWKSIE